VPESGVFGLAMLFRPSPALLRDTDTRFRVKSIQPGFSTPGQNTTMLPLSTITYRLLGTELMGSVIGIERGVRKTPGQAMRTRLWVL